MKPVRKKRKKRKKQQQYLMKYQIKDLKSLIKISERSRNYDNIDLVDSFYNRYFYELAKQISKKWPSEFSNIKKVHHQKQPRGCAAGDDAPSLASAAIRSVCGNRTCLARRPWPPRPNSRSICLVADHFGRIPPSRRQDSPHQTRSSSPATAASCR